MMTQVQIDQLFINNGNKLNKLNIASGSMIKALLMGLASNGPVYIRLDDADVGGNKVNYTHIEGDKTLVAKIGEGLGLKVTVTETENTLEVRHA